MEICRATGDDAEEISSLIKTFAHRFTLEADGEGAEIFLKSIEPDAIRIYIGSEEFQYFIGRVHGTIAGVVAMKGGTHLFHFFVAEQYQGRGLARLLWEHIKRPVLVAATARSITVNSSIFAMPIYEHFGFRKIGETVKHNGVVFVPMALELWSRNYDSRC